MGQGFLIIEDSRSHSEGFLLEKWSARRRDLYLTTYNTHNRQTSMPWVGLEPTIPASERPQTHALDRAATRIGISYLVSLCKWYHVKPKFCGHSLAGIGTVGSNPPGGMDICCEYCVLSGRGLCDGPITRPEESYRV